MLQGAAQERIKPKKEAETTIPKTNSTTTQPSTNASSVPASSSSSSEEPPSDANTTAAATESAVESLAEPDPAIATEQEADSTPAPPPDSPPPPFVPDRSLYRLVPVYFISPVSEEYLRLGTTYCWISIDKRSFFVRFSKGDSITDLIRNAREVLFRFLIKYNLAPSMTKTIHMLHALHPDQIMSPEGTFPPPFTDAPIDETKEKILKNQRAVENKTMQLIQQYIESRSIRLRTREPRMIYATTEMTPERAWYDIDSVCVELSWSEGFEFSKPIDDFKRHAGDPQPPKDNPDWIWTAQDNNDAEDKEESSSDSSSSDSDGYTTNYSFYGSRQQKAISIHDV